MCHRGIPRPTTYSRVTRVYESYAVPNLVTLSVVSAIVVSEFGTAATRTLYPVSLNVPVRALLLSSSSDAAVYAL